MCPQVLCAPPKETAAEEKKTVRFVHILPISCDDPEVPAIKSDIEAEIRNNDPSWPGTTAVSFKCTANKKRVSSTLETEASLTGAGASSQAEALSMNLQDTTVNGIAVDFVSADSNTENEESGLSDGAIAGIVIGSVAGAALIIIAAVIIMQNVHRVEQA
jgi:hypothetical protein